MRSRHRPLHPVLVEIAEAWLFARVTVNLEDLQEYFGERVQQHPEMPDLALTGRLGSKVDLEPGLQPAELWVLRRLSEIYHRKRVELNQPDDFQVNWTIQ